MWAPILLIFLAAVALTIQAASVGQVCGKFNEEQFNNNQLITEPTEHPWIGRIVNTNRNPNLLCTGVLVDAQHVVTAGSCVSLDNPYNVSGVIFGDSDSGIINSVRSISIHPDFSVGKFENDLAIIKLTKDVEFTDFVQPIVVGFDGLEKRIKMAFSKSESNECHKLVSHFAEDLICGYSERSLISGSAMLKVFGSPRKFHLMGILVAGIKTQEIDYNGYLNIRSYLSWIEQNIKQ